MHFRAALTNVLTILLVACLTPLAAAAPLPQEEGQAAVTGTWVYVKDLTEGRPLAQQGPPMSPRLTWRVEKDAVVWVRPRGEERFPSDGTFREHKKPGSTTKYSGGWQGNEFTFDAEILSIVNGSRIALMRRTLEVTKEGLVLSVCHKPDQGGVKSIALYRRAEDIPMPTPAKAKIDDLKWIAGDWVGMRGQLAMEERWGPSLGGSMLGVSRVVSRGRMVAFEYLRIVEKAGSVVYVAQPGGRAPTEFVLTKLDGKHAVFDNPRHDYPQRITYTLGADGTFRTSIGFINGGKPRAYDYKREE